MSAFPFFRTRMSRNASLQLNLGLLSFLIDRHLHSAIIFDPLNDEFPFLERQTAFVLAIR